MFNGQELNLLILEIKLEEFPIYGKLKHVTLQILQHKSIVFFSLINLEGSKP